MSEELQGGQTASTESTGSESVQQSAPSTSVDSSQTTATSEKPVSVTPTIGADGKVTYAPNYGYEVFKEKKEMPEWARPLITNKEMEENFRKLFAGHGATEQLVAKRDGYLKERDTIKSEHESLKRQLADCSDMVERGDMDAFFQAIGIPREKVLQYAMQHVEYSNLPPEQQKAYDDYIETKRANSQFEKRLMELEQRIQTDQVEGLNRSLGTVLQAQDAQVQAIDAKLKQYNPSASFRDEVILHARQVHADTGVDLPPDQAVAEVLKKYSVFLGQTPSAPGTQQSKPPVIPNVGSHNASPTKKKITSLDEMRKMASAME